jgi:hypothetical protein
MGGPNIFVSVGEPTTDEQEQFVRAIEARLKSEGMEPCTVGRNFFDADSPLKTVVNLMDGCSGAVIIALERTFFPAGISRRGGTREASLSNVKFATPWNQIEAGMAYSRGLPLLVIVENGIKSEGLLEPGYDWYVQSVKPELSALTTVQFNGVLAGWKKKSKRFNQDSSRGQKSRLQIKP